MENPVFCVGFPKFTTPRRKSGEVSNRHMCPEFRGEGRAGNGVDSR